MIYYLLLPVLSKAKARATAIQCQGNLKQLQLAWQMYVSDHNDFIPGNNWWQEAGSNGMARCSLNWTTGWEDATLGNMYAGHVISGDVKNVHTVRTGIEYMTTLAAWYTKTAKKLRTGEGSIGFFQIGGGIAGDFPICVVPMLHQDLQRTGVPLWGYFAQISDSTTSYGSYSGAVPNEKITWGKLAVGTPWFIIESDATIVAPLIFAWVLGQ